MPHLTALARRASDFKYSICMQRWATLHVAFRVAVQLLAHCRFKGHFEVYGRRCHKEVAATVRGVAPRVEFDTAHRSLKADITKGYFVTYLRTS